MGDSNSNWGSNLDMVALAHGPVGCGVFAQATCLNLPEFVQGIESFTALHACTGLTENDLEDAGDAKAARRKE
jgi:nitrogenase molybdenum-iron protein alpha chain